MINYLGGLKRRYDHIKVVSQDTEEYKPAMVIFKPNLPGVSFCITTDAIWKYIEPKDNMERETIVADVTEFNKILMRNQIDQRRAKREKLTDMIKARIVDDALCIAFSIALNKTLRIMFCTGYNLAKCLQLMAIEPEMQAAIQLLLWIQDGLGDLKDMPEALPEEAFAAGEVTVMIDGQAITKDVQLTETDLITGE